MDASTKSGYGYKSFLKWGDADAFRKKKDVEESGGVLPSTVKSISEGIDNWLDIARTEGRRNPGEPVSPATMEQYEYRARIMKRYLWPVSMRDFDEQHGIEFRSWLLQNHPRDSAHKVLSSFHSVILAMKDRRVINRDPLEKIAISNKSRYQEPVTIPSVDEFLSILRAADRLTNAKNQQIAQTWQRYRPMIYLAAGSGMRPQEYLALPPASLLSAGVNILQALDRSGQIGPPKTKAGRRFIPVGGEALDMARHYAERTGKEQFVFPTQKGGRCQQYRNYLRHGWHRLMDEAGYTEEIRDGDAIRLVRKYTPYALRHFFASGLIYENKSSKFIQSVMGHEDIKMTFDVYGHLLRRKEFEETTERGGILHCVSSTRTRGEPVAKTS